jgi:hypothetical protein
MSRNGGQMRAIVLGMVVGLLLAGAAEANRASAASFRYSGRPGDSQYVCSSCHRDVSVGEPSATVDGLEGLVAGDTALLTLRIEAAAARDRRL